MTTSAALWRRLDLPGHDFAQLAPVPGGGLRVSGVALFAFAGEPCRLDYVVLCDASGAVTSAAVSGSLAGVSVRRTIAADPQRRWSLDGAEVATVQGASDLVLAFSPATRALVPRRLGSAQPTVVRAAGLRFPELTLEPIEVDASGGGSYPGTWELAASVAG